MSEAAEELCDAVGPVLEGADIGEGDALCAQLAQLALGGVGGDAEAASSAKEEFVLKLDNIILMFAGRVLLRRSDFRLRRGGVYALIGRNGVGKTTLLTRLAARDINGFPEEVTCAYVAHEVQSDREVTVGDYARRRFEKEVGGGGDGAAVLDAALREVGFEGGAGAPGKGMKVAELSGGWRMRLALALAVARKADVLMLDEPTNHLDVGAVAWLVEWLKSLEGTTVLLVSHDVPFMQKTVDHVIHFHDLQLDYYDEPFAKFHAERPNAQEGVEGGGDGGRQGGADGGALRPTSMREDQMAEHDTPVFKFPHPGNLDNIKRRTQPVVKLTGITFQYEGGASASLSDATVRLPLGARVAIVGPNGAGKSTLLKLMIGELELVSGSPGACRGEIWRHESLRVAYVAQHSMHHLERQMNESPVGYIIRRYGRGVDKEALAKVAAKLTIEEMAQRQRQGQVSEVVGRKVTAGLLMYELRKCGLPEDRTTWEPVVSIERMAPYVMKLCRAYDEKMKALQGGAEVRPLETPEVKKHLLDFGIGPRICSEPIRQLSGGQRSRLLIAAALWNRPHILAMDEPSNYLDKESIAALGLALQKFAGGVVVVSHNADFLKEIGLEEWHVENGTVTLPERA